MRYHRPSRPVAPGLVAAATAARLLACLCLAAASSGCFFGSSNHTRRITSPFNRIVLSGTVVDDEGNPLDDVRMSVVADYYVRYVDDWVVAAGTEDRRTDGEQVTVSRQFRVDRKGYDSVVLNFEKPGYLPRWVSASVEDGPTRREAGQGLRVKGGFLGTLKESGMKVVLPSLARYANLDRQQVEITDKAGERQQVLIVKGDFRELYGRVLKPGESFDEIPGLTEHFFYVEADAGADGSSDAVWDAENHALFPATARVRIYADGKRAGGGLIKLPSAQTTPLVGLDPYGRPDYDAPLRSEFMDLAPADGYGPELVLTARELADALTGPPHYFYFKTSAGYGKGRLGTFATYATAEGEGGGGHDPDARPAEVGEPVPGWPGVRLVRIGREARRVRINMTAWFQTDGSRNLRTPDRLWESPDQFTK